MILSLYFVILSTPPFLIACHDLIDDVFNRVIIWQSINNQSASRNVQIGRPKDQQVGCSEITRAA